MAAGIEQPIEKPPKDEVPKWKTQPGGEVIKELPKAEIDLKWNEKIKKKTIAEEEKRISGLSPTDTDKLEVGKIYFARLSGKYVDLEKKVVFDLEKDIHEPFFQRRIKRRIEENEGNPLTNSEYMFLSNRAYEDIRNQDRTNHTGYTTAIRDAQWTYQHFPKFVYVTKILKKGSGKTYVEVQYLDNRGEIAMDVDMYSGGVASQATNEAVTEQYNCSVVDFFAVDDDVPDTDDEKKKKAALDLELKCTKVKETIQEDEKEMKKMKEKITEFENKIRDNEKKLTELGCRGKGIDGDDKFKALFDKSGITGGGNKRKTRSSNKTSKRRVKTKSHYRRRNNISRHRKQRR